MASIFFKRLEKKYEYFSAAGKLKGQKYQEMITEILAHNNEKAAKAVNRLTDNNYKKSVKKLSKKKEKTIKLPDVSEVLPKRSVFIIKGADTGKAIGDKLRDKLQKDLRQVLKKFDGTGKQRMETRRGVSTGKINNELVKMFEQQITDTFKNYTKRDKSLGVPKNIHNIAVTEIRSTVNTIKTEYKNNLLKKNPNLKGTKTWKHNRSLSKKPRQSHIEQDGITIDDNDFFLVGREDKSGFDRMDRPHDPIAPPGQNITCNCDIIYRAMVLDY
jgi:hypothetical protein